jgi:threonine/homoserine/homoserine lactone efflux protein
LILRGFFLTLSCVKIQLFFDTTLLCFRHQQGDKQMAIFWMCTTAALTAYAVFATVQLGREIRAYRRDKARLG